ncbi:MULTISPECIES: hypothetical protein [Ramlibacter]|uniref:Uncharacterized protein n=1 Tax=Ramlibacter pinisoli TaxID=2682844 RepID=A0A6N8IWJ6_9BURK|nr:MULTISPECIES: hypothetical protein [Ramlibacter]MBA2960979.1 hypothetical protein [Ramlibacter sp. CGMCC 1.13660]MVQ30925.1 hypothetical protein [Ramlibacter pinisoli]
MTKPPVPDDVRRFLLTSVPSVPYLEALLLMRADPETAWDAFRVAGRLYIPESHALEMLRALEAANFVVRTSEGHFCFRPATPEMRSVIDTVATTYASNLVGVTELIHSRIDKRALQFADAFRWKKEDR